MSTETLCGSYVTMEVEVIAQVAMEVTIKVQEMEVEVVAVVRL